MQYIPLLTQPPTIFPHLSSKRPLLHCSQPQIRNRRERKRQLEPDIPAKHRTSDFLANGPDKPHLRHTHHGAEDAEAEGQDGGRADGEEVRCVPDGDVVLAFFEDEMFS